VNTKIIHFAQYRTTLLLIEVVVKVKVGIIKEE
jgi:hypothetical protein